MRANPEIKCYIAPLLERRPDLVLSGRWLIMKPVTHYMRCVHFGRTRAKGVLIPRSMVIPLYERPPSRLILPGHELRRTRKCWDLRERGGEAELCDAIEARALPPVASVLTTEAYMSYLPTLDNWAIQRWGEAMYHFIVGDRAQADSILTELSVKLCWQMPDTESKEPWPQSPLLLLDLMRTNPSELLRIMHEWETGMVHLMNLDKYWQQSPFPCEMAVQSH